MISVEPALKVIARTSKKSHLGTGTSVQAVVNEVVNIIGPMLARGTDKLALHESLYRPLNRLMYGDPMDRFRQLTKKQKNGCLIWIGTRNTGNTMGGFRDGNGLYVTASHFLLPPNQRELIKTKKWCIRAMCGDKWCVNPKHLELVSRTDVLSAAREVAKPKKPAKLTDKQVEAIRRAPNIRGTNAKLARKYYVSEMLISQIRRGTRRQKSGYEYGTSSSLEAA